jgi:hypothetical protein
MPSEPCGLVKWFVRNEKYRRNTHGWMWLLPVALLNQIIAAVYVAHASRRASESSDMLRQGTKKTHEIELTHFSGK